MAVYTEIDDETLAQFAELYPLSQIDDLKGITAGVQNSNFLLTAADAKYILTVYESSANGVAADDLPFFLGLMLHRSIVAEHHQFAMFCGCFALYCLLMSQAWRVAERIQGERGNPVVGEQ